MDKPLISIIIPAKNVESTIRKCLDSILRIDYPSYEIIVVDDGSTDGTPRILSEYKNIKTITASGIGPSKTRNIAVKEAKGEFIAFTDADCAVDVNWLNELLSGFKVFPEAIACGGRQELPHDADDFEKDVFIFMKKTGFITDYMRKISKNGITEVNHNPSCNVIYRKSVFLKENGFLENLWPGEDVELDYRLRKKKYKLVFNPKAIVYHYRSKNINDFSKMMFRYGKAQGWLVRKYGIFRMIHFVPLILLSWVSLNIFGILIYPYMTKIVSFFLAIIFLLSLIIITGVFIFKKKNIVLFVIFFICGLASWNIGFVRGIAIKKAYFN